MLPVEIMPVPGGTLVLRARGSELLILPHHVTQLKNKKVPKDFTGYFLDEALLNRPARKLFEAWLRKDGSLWRRMYQCIQNDMEEAAEETAAPVAKKSGPADKPKAEKVAAKSEKPVAKAAVEEKKAAPAKVAEKEKPKAKVVEKVAAKAPAAKAPAAKSAPAKKAAPATKSKAAPSKAKKKG